MKWNWITRYDIMVLIAIVMFLLVVGFSGLQHLRKAMCRQFCGVNLEGLGIAMSVYAHDYEDQYPQLPGKGPWSKKLGFAYDLPLSNLEENGPMQWADRTITATWYLLIREMDVSPKSFICPEDPWTVPFDGKNPVDRDITELWDFGHEPHKHVSYALHNPYGEFPVIHGRPKSFIIAADMNPWFRFGDFVKPEIINKDSRKKITLLPPYFSDPSIPSDNIQQSNAMYHGREGQMVIFGDGHVEYVKTSDVGINHDNIYTYWSTPTNPTENDIRIGTNPTSRSKENDAQSADDSFLAI